MGCLERAQVEGVLDCPWLLAVPSVVCVVDESLCGNRTIRSMAEIETEATLDQKALAHSERRRRKDRINTCGQWNRVVSGMLAVHTGLASCCGENRENSS